MADRTLLPPAEVPVESLAAGNRRFAHSPRLRLLVGCYHQSGLKHLVLLVVLVGYAFLGAAVFYSIEQPKELERIGLWRTLIERNRSQLVDQILLPQVGYNCETGMGYGTPAVYRFKYFYPSQIFNDSEMLLIVEGWKIDRVRRLLSAEVEAYEGRIGVRYRYKAMRQNRTDPKRDFRLLSAITSNGTSAMPCCTRGRF